MSATSERLSLTAREVGMGDGVRAVYGWRTDPPRHGWWLVSFGADGRPDEWTWLGRGENAAHEALRRLARAKEGA